MPEPCDTSDLFRPRLAEMIDLRHPLAVLASRLPWAQIEAALAPNFARRVRDGRVLEQDDLFGPSLQIAGAGIAAAGRPRLRASAPPSARPASKNRPPDGQPA